jgi:hypothetical protein
VNPSHSILGSPLSYVFWGAAGDAWPTNGIPAELRQVHLSSVEALLVSGSIDFSTPATFARDELLPALAKGKHIILAEMGHVDDLLGLQQQATEQLLRSFYDTGESDDSLFTYAPMNFRVPLGFPSGTWWSQPDDWPRAKKTSPESLQSQHPQLGSPEDAVV